VHTTDGKQLRLSTRERPKLMFDDSGEITHLITGVCPQHSCAPTAAVNCKMTAWDFMMVQPLGGRRDSKKQAIFFHELAMHECGGDGGSPCTRIPSAADMLHKMH